MMVLLASIGPGQAQTSIPSTQALKNLSLQELMDVEVTSVSKRPEKLFDTPSALQVVLGDDVRRSGASSLPEALRLASNLHVAQRGSHAWAISARGFNTELANKLLVLIDGRTVYTPLFSGVFWDRQDYLLEDLERIEVISGPGGALWGANAVNGVINITTKSAKDTPGGFLEAGIGSNLRAFGGARYGGQLAPDVHFRVYGKYADRDAAVLADGAEATDAWDMSQGGFRLDVESGAEDRLTVQGDLYDSRQGLATGGTGTTSGGNLLGRWTHVFADGSDLSVQTYFDHANLSIAVPPFMINGTVFAPAGTFQDRLDTYDVDLQHRLTASAGHRIVWGLGYRHTRDEVENAPGLSFFPLKLSQDLVSGFIQDEIELAENVAVTLGTKLEHNDYTGWEAEPSARLQWALDSSHMVWTAISRAVRMPSRIDRHISQAAPPYLVVLAGGPDFDSETVVAYEAGYRGRLSPQVIGSASVFYNQYRRLRSTSTTPTTILPFFFANNLEGETYGLELSANFQATASWRWQFGYNLLKTDLRVRPGEFDFNNALNETADPEHQLSIRSSVDLGAHVELDAGLRWVDSLPTNSAGVLTIVPSYCELDVRVGWSPSPEVSFSLVGQNLLHDRHPEYGAPGPAREEIERSIHGRIAWRF